MGTWIRWTTSPLARAIRDWVASHQRRIDAILLVGAISVLLVARSEMFLAGAHMLSKHITAIATAVLDQVNQQPKVRFVMGVLLDALPDVSSLLLTFAGLTYLMPTLAKSIESRRKLRILLSIAFFGIGVTVIILNAVKRVEADRKQTLQEQRLESVRGQVGRVLEFLVNSKGKTSEAERRQQLLAALRGEYVIEHSEVSPGLITGSDSPPDSWTNMRLKQLGEQWSVRTPPRTAPAPQVAPEPRKAELLFSFEENDPDNYPKLEDSATLEGASVKAKITAMAVGDVTAKNGVLYIRICKACKWAKEPSRMLNESGEKDSADRAMKFQSLFPNVELTPIELEIIPPLPLPPKIGISTYYACENCPPINPKKPQTLWLKITPIKHP